MAMRMSGLMSGMDTESIVKELVAVRQTKVDKTKKAQTRQEWTQDAWKGLNDKLKKLMNKTLNNMRFTGSYSKKKTAVSDSSAASVLTSDTAMNGVQTLEINQLAKTAYMTGGKVLTRDEKLNTDAIKAEDIMSFETDGEGNKIPKTLRFRVGEGEEKSVDITADMSVSELVKKLNEGGLKAEYDETQQKILYSVSKEDANVSFSGEGWDALVAGTRKATGTEVTALTKMEDLMLFGRNAATGEETAKKLKLTLGSGSDAKEVQIEVTSSTTISDLLTKLKKEGLSANFDAKQERFFIGAGDSGAAGNFEISGDSELLEALGLNISKKITSEGTQNIAESGATYVQGQDAKIVLNGAVFENNSNVFDINGLIITAQNTTEPGKSITLTTQNDTDGIYDMIKNFFKEYNEIINEIDKLYNADAAKGYEPLTSEEKDAMTDTEIEEWEKKVKDSLLRRDSNLNSISSALKEVMLSSINVNGRKMFLGDFGIATLGYFASAANEKNAYHIDGDEDDSDTSANEDKLKAMITSDPEAVVSFFSQLTQNLYKKMDSMSRSVEGIRSFGSFYDDKKMKSEYDSYKSKIKDQEQKLADYEDKWYKKFAAMEKAMAKLQQNASAVTGLLGMGGS